MDNLAKIAGEYCKWAEDIFEDFIKNYNDEGDEVVFQYPKNVCNFHYDLPFLSKRIKIENVAKPVPNLHCKREYVTQIGNSKQILNHE